MRTHVGAPAGRGTNRQRHQQPEGPAGRYIRIWTDMCILHPQTHLPPPTHTHIHTQHTHKHTQTQTHTHTLNQNPYLNPNPSTVVCEQGGLLSVVAKSIKVSIKPASGVVLNSIRSGGRFTADGKAVGGGQEGGAFRFTFKPPENGQGGESAAAADAAPGSLPVAATALSVSFNDLYAGRCAAAVAGRWVLQLQVYSGCSRGCSWLVAAVKTPKTV